MLPALCVHAFAGARAATGGSVLPARSLLHLHRREAGEGAMTKAQQKRAEKGKQREEAAAKRREAKEMASGLASACVCCAWDRGRCGHSALPGMLLLGCAPPVTGPAIARLARSTSRSRRGLSSR